MDIEAEAEESQASVGRSRSCDRQTPVLGTDEAVIHGEWHEDYPMGNQGNRA